MDLFIRLEGRSDLARQIYRQISSSDRRRDARARRLSVSRNTVSVTYEWIVAEGLVSGRQGAGSFVEGNAIARGAETRAGAAIRHRTIWNRFHPPAPRATPPRFDFGVGMPDGALFPYADWRRAMARQIRASRLTSQYADPAGHPGLRESIARHVAVSRGVRVEPDDVIVTNGAQQAFDLIARVLSAHGSMEANVVSIPVDEEGLVVDALPKNAALVYVTPSHQFPMGMPMSNERRIALLQWAERRNSVIIEDDYDSEFRFGGRPLETLQAADRNGRVIYAGSFSKSLLPALRLGFLIAPPSLRNPLRAAIHAANWFAQWPAQAALASCIDEGHLARHIRKMRRIYSERHAIISTTLQKDFTRWLVPIPAVTGMHLTATLRSRSRQHERDLAARAAARGIGFDLLSTYWTTGRKHRGLVLGYGSIATGDIAEGCADCASVSEPGQLIVSPKPIVDYLVAHGGSMKGEYVMIADWPVQFLPPAGPLVEEALGEAIEADVGGVTARVFTAEHLAAIALQTGRAKDKARLLQFFEEKAPDTARFQQIVRRYDLVDAWLRFEGQFLADTP
jgi:GntR family transcriptional regulator/MocR family aminotransferase